MAASSVTGDFCGGAFDGARGSAAPCRSVPGCASARLDRVMFDGVMSSEVAVLLNGAMSELPIHVLNGPNLNTLGTRKPEIYGYTTLADVERNVRARAQTYGLDVVFEQSNYEGQLVDWIQRARTEACGIVINPAALTHYSVALHDALEMCEMPIVEVHISNVHRREAFRHTSFVSPQATAVIAGAGVLGYELGVQVIANELGKNTES